MSSDRSGGPERSLGKAGWSAAILGPLAVSAVMLVFRSEFFPVNAALLLVLPVLAAAIVGGRRGGVVAAVAAAVNE